MSTYVMMDICSDTLLLQIIQWVMIGFIGIGLTITIITGIVGHKELKSKPLPFTYVYMFYSCIILGIIEILLFAATISICHINISHNWSFIAAVVSFTVYGLMISHLFLSWVSRLYITFNGTTYAKSDTFYVIISIIFVFIILFSITGLILYNISMKFIAAILVTVSGFMYFFVSISILQSFQQQLLKLITARIVTLRVNTEAALQQRTSKICLSFKDQQLVHCMAKYFVLGVTSFSTTLLVLIAMLLQFFNLFNSEYLNNIMFRVLQMLIMIDVVTNVLCVYLQFSFANVTYMKLCKCFHEKINKQIEGTAVNKLRGDTFTFYAQKFASTVHRKSVNEVKIDTDMDNVEIITTNSMVVPTASNNNNDSIDFDQLIDFNKLNSKEIHQQIEKKVSQCRNKNKVENKILSDSEAVTP